MWGQKGFKVFFLGVFAVNGHVIVTNIKWVVWLI